jgi:hypothetical protein
MFVLWVQGGVVVRARAAGVRPGVYRVCVSDFGLRLSPLVFGHLKSHPYIMCI